MSSVIHASLLNFNGLVNSTGQKELQALSDSNSPHFLYALATNSEQKYVSFFLEGLKLFYLNNLLNVTSYFFP